MSSRKRQRTQAKTTPEPEVVLSADPTPVDDSPLPTVTLPATPASKIGRPFIDTPTRATRIEEKNELATLNKRLEYYILCQKERDASTANLRNELAQMRDKGRQDFKELSEMYSTQVNSNMRAREKLAGEVAQLHDENGRLQHDLQHAQSQLDALNKDRAELESRLQDRTSGIRDLQNKNIKLEDRVQQLEHQLKAATAQNESLSTSLAEARQQAASSASTLIQEKSQHQDVAGKNMLKIAHLETELKSTRDELATMLKERAQVEDQLRKEFGQQLKDLIAERKLQHDQEKQELARDLRNAFEEKLRDYQQEIEESKRALQEEQKKHREAIAELGKSRAEVIDARALYEAGQREVQDLKKEILQVTERYSSQIAELTEKYNSIREMLRVKNEEYNNLIDVKITLAMEIKAYRALLETEELRLGYASFSEKPATTSTGIIDADAPQLSRRGSVDATNSMLITHIDLDGTFIKLKNGSTEDISLSGWSIRSRKRRAEFRFPPSIVVAPGDIITIYIGKDAKSKLRGPTDLAWSVESAFHPKGDTATLSDQFERPVARVEVLS